MKDKFSVLDSSSLNSFIYFCKIASLYRKTSHVDPLATWDMSAGLPGAVQGFKDHLPAPFWRRAGGIVKLSRTSATALTTEMVNFWNNVPFPCGLRRGMLTCITVFKIQGEEKKKRKVKIFIWFMLEKSPHAVYFPETLLHQYVSVSWDENGIQVTQSWVGSYCAGCGKYRSWLTDVAFKCSYL